MSLIRVLIIPPSSGNFHFSGGEPQAFVEVDWFRDDPFEGKPETGTEEWKQSITDFIKIKRYFREDRPLLILHPQHSFTIGYEAP